MLKTVQVHPNLQVLRLVDSTSRKLKDGLVTNIDQNRLVNIRYHVKSCYATYKKKGARQKVEIPKRKPEEPDLSH